MTAGSYELWDIVAEQVTLGGCLWSLAVFADVRTQLSGPAAFVRPAHQGLWAVLVARADAGESTDPVAVWDAVAPNRIPGVDGSYLHTLVEACPVPANAVHAAARIARLARLRDWEQLATAVLDRVHSRDADPDEIDAYGWARIEDAVRAREQGDMRQHAARAGYAYAALRGEVRRVLSTHPDSAEEAVRSAASKLARLVAAGVLPRDVAADALGRAAHRVGLDSTRSAAAIASGLAAGERFENRAAREVMA